MRSFVIGNVALDEGLSAPVLPQAGFSILGRAESCDLGGKGANQAVVMARAGLMTTLVAAIGEDARGGGIRAMLSQEPLETRLFARSGISSDFSIVFTTPDGENAIVTTTEAADSLTLANACDALASAKAGDFVVLQGNLTAEVTRGTLVEARRRGLVAACNPSPLRSYFSDLWSLFDIVFLNEGEATSVTGAHRDAAAAELRAAGVRQVVLTLGSEGAALFDSAGRVTVPAAPAKVVDTTGAGDTFLGAALASAARRGQAIDALALRHAAEAAAISVSRRGTRSSFPTGDELAAILSH